MSELEDGEIGRQRWGETMRPPSCCLATCVAILAAFWIHVGLPIGAAAADRIGYAAVEAACGGRIRQWAELPSKSPTDLDGMEGLIEGRWKRESSSGLLRQLGDGGSFEFSSSQPLLGIRTGTLNISGHLYIASPEADPIPLPLILDAAGVLHGPSGELCLACCPRPRPRDQDCRIRASLTLHYPLFAILDTSVTGSVEFNFSDTGADPPLIHLSGTIHNDEELVRATLQSAALVLALLEIAAVAAQLRHSLRNPARAREVATLGMALQGAALGWRWAEDNWQPVIHSRRRVYRPLWSSRRWVVGMASHASVVASWCVLLAALQVVMAAPRRKKRGEGGRHNPLDMDHHVEERDDPSWGVVHMQGGLDEGGAHGGHDPWEAHDSLGVVQVQEGHDPLGVVEVQEEHDPWSQVQEALHPWVQGGGRVVGVQQAKNPWGQGGGHSSSGVGPLQQVVSLKQMALALSITLPLYILAWRVTATWHPHRPLDAFLELLLPLWLLPQVIANVSFNLHPATRPLASSFLLGVSACRFLSLAHTRFRPGLPVYADLFQHTPRHFFWSLAFCLHVLLLIAFLQQTMGGRFFLPLHFRNHIPQSPSGSLTKKRLELVPLSSNLSK